MHLDILSLIFLLNNENQHVQEYQQDLINISILYIYNALMLFVLVLLYLFIFILLIYLNIDSMNILELYLLFVIIYLLMLIYHDQYVLLYKNYEYAILGNIMMYDIYVYRFVIVIGLVVLLV